VKKKSTKKRAPAKRGGAAKARPRPPPKPVRRPAPAAPARARHVPAAAHARRNGATKLSPAASAPSALASDEPIRLLAPDGAWLGGAKDPPPAPELSLELFRGMLRVRLLDGRMLNLQRQGRIGFYGQSTGQEAAIIGSAAAATAQDWIAPALREAGVAVWRGLPLSRLIAQCMARDGEPSRGRQMTCHYTFRAGNFISMSSVIATQLVHATGIALAARIKKDPIVAIGYLGDGATSEHDFHSALNFAAVWKAPVVFFCQSNQWVSIAHARREGGRAGCQSVDGNDVVAVHRVTRASRPAAARPSSRLTSPHTLLLGRPDRTATRRGREGSMRDRAPPRRGLLTKTMRRLRGDGDLRRDQREALPEPAAESLVEDVFAEPTPQLVAQRDDLLRSLGQSGAPPSAHAHGR
jgi:2-oxoisovalerate dehydrogenase E1 component alpha subunit